MTWWRGLVGFRADDAQPARRRAPGDDRNTWLRAKAQRYAAVFDPPAFASLASMPELRAVARASRHSTVVAAWL